MDGIGAVTTSSPTSSTSGCPFGSYASTRAPRPRQAITPARTGKSTEGPTKPVHTSVPPESEPRSTDDETDSYTQAKPSAATGEPADPIPRSADIPEPFPLPSPS